MTYIYIYIYDISSLRVKHYVTICTFDISKFFKFISEPEMAQSRPKHIVLLNKIEYICDQTDTAFYIVFLTTIHKYIKVSIQTPVRGILVVFHATAKIRGVTLFTQTSLRYAPYVVSRSTPRSVTLPNHKPLVYFTQSQCMVQQLSHINSANLTL